MKETNLDLDRGDIFHELMNLNGKLTEQVEKVMQQNDKLIAMIKDYLPEYSKAPKLKIVKKSKDDEDP